MIQNVIAGLELAHRNNDLESVKSYAMDIAQYAKSDLKRFPKEYDLDTLNGASEALKYARGCKHNDRDKWVIALCLLRVALGVYHGPDLANFVVRALAQLANENNARRGQKQVNSASEGGKTRWEKEGFKHLADELQKAVNEMHDRNPRLSYAEIKRKVASDSKCSASTVKNYTVNPNKPG